MVPHSFIPLSFTLHRLTGNQKDIEFCGDVCQFEKNAHLFQLFVWIYAQQPTFITKYAG